MHISDLMKCSVVGGGVSGLSAAFYLKTLVPSLHVTVHEASATLGGWIQTTRTENGLVLEHGPRTIRPVGPKGANTLELVETLGLTSKVKPILKSHPSALNRMIYVNGELHRLPNNLKSLFLRQEPFER